MEYKFKHIFNFINIIHESVMEGVEFWNFDPVFLQTEQQNSTETHCFINILYVN